MDLRQSYPAFLAGEAHTRAESLPLTDKRSGETVASVSKASRDDLARAIEGAAGVFERFRSTPAHARRAALTRIASLLRERKEEIALTMAIEVGKPIALARAETDRAVDTFTGSAELCSRLDGVIQNLDATVPGEKYSAYIRRVPVGPVGFITPFNFPLNLAAHKIGPALAVGCPFVLKPASHGAATTALLGEILRDATRECLPKGCEAWFSILPLASKDASALVEDERLKTLSFTGSGEVGWGLRAKAVKKRVVLELGGVACCLVDEGVRGKELERAADRIVWGAFAFAGQSCISVQRVFAHTSVLGELRGLLQERAAAVTTGDVLDEKTLTGPLISEGDAQRVKEWIDESSGDGAKVLAGGQRDGRFVKPTIIENPAKGSRLTRDEVFGPACTLEPFEEFGEALSRVNAMPYGLQTGVFTPSLDRAMHAWDALEVGGVVINDVPTSRVDAMPYGGVKDSGVDREGPRWAIDHLTEMRTMVVRGRE
ncbi:MAG: aldehyde dehydrogenase family protein [Phycisphaeraceae bacterium]|nr:aldehyde dehydrogenase family protein [Phycisphaeraceae bacterium]